MLKNRFQSNKTQISRKIRIKLLLTTIFLFFAVFNLSVNTQPNEITSLISDGRYEEVVSRLKKQLKHTKDIEQLSLIYNQIGEIQYEHLHDYHAALKTYQSIVELSQKGPALERSEGLSKDEIILSLMKIGDIYCRIGKYDQAIGTYERLIEDYPQSGLSNRIVQRKVQNIKTALSKLNEQEKIIQRNPQNRADLKNGNRSKDTILVAIQAHFQIAELLRTSLNNPEDAITRYEELLKRYPYSSVAPEAGWRIGDVYDKVLNSKDKAIEAYKDVVVKYPTSHFAAEALFRIGRIYEEGGNCGKALDAFDELIQQWPDFWKLPAVFYWKGKCLEELKDYGQAINAYKTFVIAYLPQTDQARLGDIGKYQQSKLKIESEIENKINALQAQMPSVEWGKAQVLIEKGNYLEALPIYRKLPTIAPNSKWAEDAKKQIRTIEYQAGIQRLRKKIESLPPGDYQAMIAQERIAEIYERELKDYDKAIAEYNLVLSNYPKNSLSAKALYRIGTIYAKKIEKTDKAIKIYNRLIKDFPNSSFSTMANYELAEVYCSVGKYKEAIAAYENVLKCPSRTHYNIGNGYTDSFADRAQFRIGRILYQNLRDFNSAEKAFNAFVEEHLDSPRLAAAYVFLSLISEEQKEYVKTVKYLQKAIDLILSNGSIQSEMIVNEIPTITLPDKEPMTVLKYLKDKINSLKYKQPSR